MRPGDPARRHLSLLPPSLCRFPSPLPPTPFYCSASHRHRSLFMRFWDRRRGLLGGPARGHACSSAVKPPQMVVGSVWSGTAPPCRVRLPAALAELWTTTAPTRPSALIVWPPPPRVIAAAVHRPLPRGARGGAGGCPRHTVAWAAPGDAPLGRLGSWLRRLPQPLPPPPEDAPSRRAIPASPPPPPPPPVRRFAVSRALTSGSIALAA